MEYNATSRKFIPFPEGVLLVVDSVYLGFIVIVEFREMSRLPSLVEYQAQQGDFSAACCGLVNVGSRFVGQVVGRVEPGDLGNPVKLLQFVGHKHQDITSIILCENLQSLLLVNHERPSDVLDSLV